MSMSVKKKRKRKKSREIPFWSWIFVYYNYYGKTWHLLSLNSTKVVSLLIKDLKTLLYASMCAYYKGINIIIYEK